MTKQRKAATEHKAIHLAIGHLSDADIFDATGKSTSLYRQCSDPDLSSHNISFSDAAKLAGKLIETGNAEHFTEAFGAMVRAGSGKAAPAIDDVDTIVSTLNGCQSLAETIRASRCPKGPSGHIRTPAECDAIISAGAELIAEVQRVIHALEGEQSCNVEHIHSKEAS